MKNIPDALKNNLKTYRHLILLALLLSSVLFTLGQIVLAQNEFLKINGKEVKEYLMEKYELKKHDVTSTLKQTPNGVNGSIHIRGNLTPKKTITPKKEKYGRARAVAEAFLEEESMLLFGITNLADISEFSISGDGWTHILYYRYVGNLRLEGSDIQIHVQPDGKIASVEAILVPVNPELLEAVNRETLSDAEIRKVVKDDLIKSGIQSPEVQSALKYIQDMKAEKVAIRMAPYVIWKAKSVWVYTINAFTGEILAKSPPWGFE